MNELTPKIKPQAPQSLKENVVNQIKKKEYKMKVIKIRKIAAIAAMVTALLVLPFLFRSNEAKAMTLLGESIKMTEELKTMVIKFFVRTDPQDNFDYIDPTADFVEHKIEKSFENPQIWRVEKTGRIAVFDGKNSKIWIKPTNEIIEFQVFGNIFGEVNNYLLSPKTLLEKAKLSAKSKGAKVDLKEVDNQLILSIETKAQGDFSQSDYLKNSSISESDSKQTYVFDKETKLLKSLNISILVNGKYVEILKTQSIDYNVPLDKHTLLDLPKNLKYVTLSGDFSNSKLQNISSKQAVELMLNALKNKDIEPLKEGFTSGFSNEKFLKEYYGLEILQIGEPFKSGVYNGEFVPVNIKLANGEIEQHNIAVRNDNKNKVWVLDGGF
ncbi:MAG: hypothetical protein LBT29_04090 [Flavobacteriaceae bacterium]|jgi:hypothetical protein|nr:hypothetical protein [Flavobacteriaceae bacterium]